MTPPWSSGTSSSSGRVRPGSRPLRSSAARACDPLVLEAGPEPGAAWRERYDRLHLHTPRLLSGLPGRRIPRRYGRWVSRDDLIAYLREYADAERIDVRTGTKVERVDRDGDGWTLATSEGPLAARSVIVATGYNGEPFVPDWPGRDRFAGELIHSAEYRNPRPFRDRDVLVVGAGNSGAEIATDVAEGGASRSRLSVRTPPQIVRRATAGIPAQLLGNGDPPDAAGLGRPDHEDAAQALDPRPLRARAAAPGARGAHVVRHHRDDADPRRRHRLGREARPRRDRRRASTGSTVPTSCWPTARASHRTR